MPEHRDQLVIVIGRLPAGLILEHLYPPYFALAGTSPGEGVGFT